MADILKAVAFLAPALLGVVAAVIGAGQVRFLRQKTGDRSAVTRVLSGQAFERQHDREAA